MGRTKKAPGSPDLLFPPDRKWGHVNYPYHMAHLCQIQQLPYTVFVTDKNTFSQTLRGAGTQDYTSYFSISAQTQIHQHTPNKDIRQVSSKHST